MTSRVVTKPALPQGWSETEWAELVNSLTRRRLIGGALAAALLAACGDHDATPKATTRTIADAYGNVTVPVSPKRIIAVDPYSLFTMLDSGITPIATTSSASFASIGPDKYKTVVAALPSVGAFGAIKVEKIASLQPDLVLGLSTYLDGAMHAKINQVASAYALSYNRNLTWQQMDQGFAMAANRMAGLNRAKRAFTDHQTTVAQRYGQVLRANTWEFVLGKESNFYRLGTASDWANVLESMGATLGNVGQVDFFGPLLSFERINLLEQATVIIASPTSQRLLEQPLWRELPAAKTGHVYTAKNVNCYSGADELVDLVAEICQEIGGSN